MAFELPRGGTVAVYQGFVALEVTYALSSGVDPDATTIVAAVPDVEALQDAPGEDLSVPDVIGMLRGAPAVNVRGGAQLRATGSLALAQEVRGEIRTYTHEGLHVVSHSRIGLFRDRTRQRWGAVTIALVDDRGLYDRGYLDRWEFLRPDGAGATPERDVDPVTKRPWTLAGVARHLTSRLYRSPKLERYPARWDELPGVFSVEPGTRPRAAMRQFLEQARGRFVLNPDRSVSLWAEGETRSKEDGTLVTISGGELKPNRIEDLSGRGHRGGTAVRHTPTHAVVVGGERIRTVEVECEPVVMVDGAPVPLEEGLEQLRQRLTNTGDQVADASANRREFAGGRAADLEAGATPAAPPAKLHPTMLAYVRRACLRPAMLVGREGEFFEAISRDAYRLWRPRNADDEQRHLLPVLNRAERKGGSDVRLPPELVAFTFQKRTGFVRRNLETGRVEAVAPDRIASEERAVQLRAESAYAEAVERLHTRAREAHLTPDRPDFDTRGYVQPLIGSARAESPDTAAARVGAQLVLVTINAESPGRHAAALELVHEALGLGVNRDLVVWLRDEEEAIDTSAAVVRGQRGEAPRPDLDGDVTFAFEAAQKQLASVDLSLRLPAAIDTFERLKKLGEESEKNGPFATRLVARTWTPDNALVDETVRFVLTKVDEIEKRAQLTPAELQAGLLPEATYFTNDGPQPVDSIVEDSAQGLFRSKGRVLGHLDRTDVDTLVGRQLVPQRVVARYGVRVTAERVGFAGETGGTSTSRRDGSQLEERFVRAFKRAEGEVEPVPVAEVPRDDCVTLRRPDIGPELIELAPPAPIPVNARNSPVAPAAAPPPTPPRTNATELEVKAAAAAAEALSTPGTMRSRELTFLWPQQVPLDGLVASLQISGRPGRRNSMRGFRTVITEGREGKITATTGTRTRGGGDEAGAGINDSALRPGER